MAGCGSSPGAPVVLSATSLEFSWNMLQSGVTFGSRHRDKENVFKSRHLSKLNQPKHF